MTQPPPGTCGAYYGTRSRDGSRWAICVRSPGHPPVWQDGIGHSDVAGDSIPEQWDAGERRAAARHAGRDDEMTEAQRTRMSMRVDEVLHALGLTIGRRVVIEYLVSGETRSYRLDDVRFLGPDPVLWVSPEGPVVDTDPTRVPYHAIANVRPHPGEEQP